MTNEWMYGYTLFRQSPISPRLSVSVFRPGEAVESSAATMARWKTNPTEIDWDGLHLTTSYNILNPTWKLQSPGRLQHLRSNIWNASGIPGIFFQPDPSFDAAWSVVEPGRSPGNGGDWDDTDTADTDITMKFTMKNPQNWHISLCIKLHICENVKILVYQYHQGL